MKFFRISNDISYEQSRGWLDSQFGHVAPRTCVVPADRAPRDSSGAIVLSVRDEFTEFSAVKAILPQLIASGVVQEITAEAYRESLPKPAMR